MGLTRRTIYINTASPSQAVTPLHLTQTCWGWHFMPTSIKVLGSYISLSSAPVSHKHCNHSNHYYNSLRLCTQMVQVITTMSSRGDGRKWDTEDLRHGKAGGKKTEHWNHRDRWFHGEDERQQRTGWEFACTFPHCLPPQAQHELWIFSRVIKTLKWDRCSHFRQAPFLNF